MTLDFDTLVDARGLHCPMPVLRLKRALSAVPAGHVLKVVATDSAAQADFRTFCDKTGHELMAVRVNGLELEFFVRKAMAGRW